MRYVFYFFVHLDDQNYVLSRSEFLNSNGSIFGENLPISTSTHCMVATEYGTYSTGGYHDATTEFTTGRRETYFLPKYSNLWENGPDLIYKRREHACGLFTFSNTDVLIVAGGFGNSSMSTELLKVGEDEMRWQPGPDLPHEVFMHDGHTIVSNGESLYYINTFVNVFYELICPGSLTNCYWEPLYEAKLNYPRHLAVALMLPDDMADMVDCG